MSFESMVKSLVDGLTADAYAVEAAMSGGVVSSIETHIPSLAPILGEIASVAGKVTGAGELLSWLMTGAEIAKDLGVRPMDPNEQAEQDKKFHYGDETGG